VRPTANLLAGRRPHLWLALLLVTHAALATHSLLQKSVTVDEYAHLPAGLSYLQKATFGLYHQNPPLLKMLAALPPLAAGANVDYAHSWVETNPPNRWLFGDDFQAANPTRPENGDVVRYHELFNLARLVVVALSCLGAWLIFRWGSEIYGATGALMAATIWCLSPNVLAHARLVTTDVAAAVAFVAALYAFWCWHERGGWPRCAAAGFVLGLAQLTKFTCLLLYPVSLALVLVWHLGTPRRRRRALLPELTGWIAAVVISVAIINAGYLGEGSFQRLGAFDFTSRTLTLPQPSHAPETTGRAIGRDHRRPSRTPRSNRFRNTLLAALPVPLPYHYVAGFDAQKRESETGIGPDGQRVGYPVFLNGEHRRSGWWYYYLACIAYKVPLFTLAWLGLATCLAIARIPPVRIARDGTFAIAALFILIAMSAATDIDIGIRYVLPLWPFLCLWIGRLGGLPPRRGRLALAAIALLGLVPVAGIHPHYLSYFNAIAGGPVEGRHRLIDSNLDWGQDLVALKRLLDQEGIDKIWLAYFGNEDPATVGIDFELPRGPEPGWNAVSVNYVMGLPFSHIRDGRGNRVRLERPLFIGYQRFEPVARAGYSIDLYYLTAEDIASAAGRTSKMIAIGSR